MELTADEKINEIEDIKTIQIKEKVTQKVKKIKKKYLKK